MAAASAPAAVPTFVWSDDHDGGGLFTDDGFRVLSDPAGHAVVAGESADLVGGIDLAIRKLDRTDGHELWQTRYQGYDDKDVAVTDMTWDSVGQLIVAGFIRGCVG
jgi:hypothetical protein